MVSQILGMLSSFALSSIQKTGYLGIFFLMVLESASIPIPSEVTMGFSGFLVASGVFNFWLVALAGTFGNLGGSLLSYWFGHLIRNNVLHWNTHKVSKDVEKVENWLHRFGSSTVFVSQLLPVARTFISFPLGILDAIPVWRFSVLTFIGAFIWCAFLTWLGVVFNNNWTVLEGYFKKFDYLILFAIIAVGILFIWKHYIKKDEEELESTLSPSPEIES